MIYMHRRVQIRLYSFLVNNLAAVHLINIKFQEMLFSCCWLQMSVGTDIMGRVIADYSGYLQYNLLCSVLQKCASVSGVHGLM